MEETKNIREVTDNLDGILKKEKSPLTPNKIAGSFIGMGAIAAVSIGLVFVFQSIPGATLALKVLTK